MDPRESFEGIGKVVLSYFRVLYQPGWYIILNSAKFHAFGDPLERLSNCFLGLSVTAPAVDLVIQADWTDSQREVLFTRLII